MSGVASVALEGGGGAQWRQQNERNEPRKGIVSALCFLGPPGSVAVWHCHTWIDCVLVWTDQWAGGVALTDECGV